VIYEEGINFTIDDKNKNFNTLYYIDKSNSNINNILFLLLINFSSSSVI